MVCAPAPVVTPLGDAALLVTFPPVIDAALNARILRLAARLRAGRLEGIRDVVPAYASCAVYFDPLRIDRRGLQAAVTEAIAESARDTDSAARGSTVFVPVCYGGALGPDLMAVALHAGCSEDEVVRIHAGREYRVFMTGFLPGFPYLGPLDDRIAVPRLAAPRACIPAGSVGIAERQTGIYPTDAPGGWHILGRTPLRLFDPMAQPPARLRPGDTVRFIPIDEHEYRTAR